MLPISRGRVAPLLVATLLASCWSSNRLAVGGGPARPSKNLSGLTLEAPGGGIFRADSDGSVVTVRKTGCVAPWSSRVQVREGRTQANLSDAFYSPSVPDSGVLLVSGNDLFLVACASWGSGAFVARLDCQSGKVLWSQWVGPFRDRPLVRRNPIPGRKVYNELYADILAQGLWILGREGARSYCSLVSMNGDAVEGVLTAAPQSSQNHTGR